MVPGNILKLLLLCWSRGISSYRFFYTDAREYLVTISSVGARSIFLLLLLCWCPVATCYRFFSDSTLEYLGTASCLLMSWNVMSLFHLGCSPGKSCYTFSAEGMSILVQLLLHSCPEVSWYYFFSAGRGGSCYCFFTARVGEYLVTVFSLLIPWNIMLTHLL